jgi:hypothetical protein
MDQSAAPVTVAGWSDEHLQMLHQGGQIPWDRQVRGRRCKHSASV